MNFSVYEFVPIMFSNVIICETSILISPHFLLEGSKE
jgi:hypothetical protein